MDPNKPNQHSAQIEVECVTNAVAELLKGGYIAEVMQPIICCNQWSEQNKSMLIDLFGNKNSNMMTRVAMMMFKQGEWMFSFDLKSVYHHVNVVMCHHKYLGLEAITCLLCCHLNFLQNLMSSLR